MSDLDDLLDSARSADPSSRILFRDAIAAYGQPAITPMAEWLPDPRLGAFGVRVLQRLAVDPAIRADVVAVLAAAGRRGLSPDVAGDVAHAIADLRPPTLPRGSGKTKERIGNPAPGAGRARGESSTTEDRFHDAMFDIYWLAGRATGYWANYFLRAVRAHGGIAAARELLRKTGTSPGFARLTAEGRLDLSMEALVLRPEFAILFTPQEVQIAHQRLVVARHATDAP